TEAADRAAPRHRPRRQRDRNALPGQEPEGPLRRRGRAARRPRPRADDDGSAGRGVAFRADRQFAILHAPMTLRQQIEQIADRLPVAVYLVAEDGKLLYANERLRLLLAMSGSDDTRHNMAEFYADPADRL